MDFDGQNLLVVALGGNALSPPGTSDANYAAERTIIAATGQTLNKLITQGYRLLIVHGNGPQVGRLLGDDPNPANLDIHVAQTQGELGYLLSAAVEDSPICVLTRVLVDAYPGPPVKPVGPWLTAPPADDSPCVRAAQGWRRLVASPKPQQILESESIAELLNKRHVIAGGGGGIAVDAKGAPVTGVIDKDWVASMLAVELNAQALVFATDVDGVFSTHDQLHGQPLPQLDGTQARRMIEHGHATAGAMAPKLESAATYALKTGRAAYICHLSQMIPALAGKAGTTVIR